MLYMISVIPGIVYHVPVLLFFSLSVSGHGGISCLQQEQKVAQDERCFLSWNTQHVPTGPNLLALHSEEMLSEPGR